ncbi:MBOAT family O-acyltransferase [Cellulomonas aerilata]|uniref:Poly(Beta-D-mannuronate) O-acetylase n=1 Tax=Cellulomonas aerilata TaxID=515326 RepID=A0A512DDA9_9CELL|nr:MBOAT family protein [Cellulomonas aerilata]GEO34464.1 poly(beta-D-mannuronate) O-acetylase [Cellulomonas aerilata]
MVFSSYTFIFAFFPIFLVVYALLSPRYRNPWILVASLSFYGLGDPGGLPILIGAIVVNYGVGALMGPLPPGEEPRRNGRRRALMWTGVAVNLAVLGYYKYVGFLTTNLDALAERVGLGSVPVVAALLPLGISFFVFQGVSYLIDVYRGTVVPTRSLLTFATYKSLFPQLIAGPIVRYSDIADDLPDRTIRESMVYAGIVRFLTGFCKKVLLADTFAVTADAIFGLPPDQLDTGTAWLGALAYTLQIYFDFSAYSDMAIGMGLMMGFRFPENFNYPYISRSIREFWRRWHMTLSGWFRDYVYISLGGNRKGSGRTYVNLMAVFVLTGLWHGAAWTFVVWGLWHGLFIVAERATRFEERVPGAIRWVYTMAVVVFGWVLFRAETFEGAFHMMALMLGLESGPGLRPVGEFWSGGLAVAVVAGLVLSLPVYPWLRARLPRDLKVVAGTVMFAGLFALAAAKVLAGAYSPFLYFRF